MKYLLLSQASLSQAPPPQAQPPQAQPPQAPPSQAPPLKAPSPSPLAAAPPHPVPLPPAPLPAAVWEVELKGQFCPYEAAVQSTLEAAFQSGAHTTMIRVGGQAYEVGLRGAALRQRGVGAEAWRSRKVRRRT